VDVIYGIARLRLGWLVVLTLLLGAMLVPPAAIAGVGFTFVPDPAQPSLAPGSTVAAVAELTGTGVPDLVLIDGEDNSVGVMPGNGAGGFGAPTWYQLAGKPAGVSVADFNNDGHADLLVGVETAPPPTPQEGTTPNKVQILSGDGQGNFTVGQPIAMPEIGRVAVGDFTGNGDQDAVVVPDACTGGGNGGKYYMLLGDGHGDLAPGPVYESPRGGGCGSWVGDFTGDGRDDILTQSTGPGEEEAIVVLPGESNGSFGLPVVTPTPELAHHAAFVAGVGDLDGDGKLDVVVRVLEESAGQVVVFHGDGAGGFTEGGSYQLDQPNTYNFDVALGAFADDGDVDIAAIGAQHSGTQSFGSQLTLFANNGAGVFSSALTSPLAGSFGSVFVADVNGDGRPDIILSLQSELHIFLDEPASPPSNPPPSAPLTKPIAPSVQRASESAKRWREGKRLAKISRRAGPPVGTTFSFSLNEPATVSFSFTRRASGRSVRGKCVAKSPKNAEHKTCKRTVADDTLSFTGNSGSNKVIFAGRISRSNRLKPGNYTLTITATNAAGHSAPAHLTFTIVA
jgi:hypothetical protein